MKLAAKHKQLFIEYQYMGPNQYHAKICTFKTVKLKLIHFVKVEWCDGYARGIYRHLFGNKHNFEMVMESAPN